MLWGRYSSSNATADPIVFADISVGSGQDLVVEMDGFRNDLEGNLPAPMGLVEQRTHQI